MTDDLPSPLPAFVFEANLRWLDFVNTEMVVRGERVDTLRDPTDLGRWLRAAGMTAPSRISASVLAAFLRLRSALRALAMACVQGQPVPRTAFVTLGDALGATPGRMRLFQQGARVDVAFEPDEQDEMSLLWPIALSAATWLREGDRSLLKQCSSEECILFFYDTTRNHSRRWCSMTTCGNREKVRAFHKRQRRDPR